MRTLSPMRGVLVVLGLSLAVASVAVAGSAVAAAAKTELRITIWPRGKDEPNRKQTWTLRCNPTGGSLPKAVLACRQLARVPRPFRPVAPDAVCTRIYGGPTVAQVRGTLRGRRVSATFSRKDGCEIARWDRVGALFPIFVVAPH